MPNYTAVPPHSTAPITLTAECPLCHGVLKLRQRRDGRGHYIACARRPYEFTAAYDPVLERLRDRIARLEAELAFVHMQARPAVEDSPATAEEHRRALTTWAHVAYRFVPHPADARKER
jgi:hypothetical protein